MSTRGCVAVGTPKKWRGIYNHSDSYPTGLGVELYEHVMRQVLEGKALADIADSILKFDDWRNYLAGGVCQYCGKLQGQPHTISGGIYGKEAVNGQYPDPEAKHHEHNDLTKVTEDQITSKNPDPLFIEWVYVLDPEANAIHVLAHQSCKTARKLKKPVTSEEYSRQVGDRTYYSHCVYKHVLRATIAFDKKPDWEAIECGETYERCHHYAYAHFPELKGTPSEYLNTQQYIGREPVTDHNYCVAYLINGKFHWKGGSGHSGGFARLGGERGVWYEGIPMEVNAYELGGRFERSPHTRFSVADEVGAWVREERF